MSRESWTVKHAPQSFDKDIRYYSDASDELVKWANSFSTNAPSNKAYLLHGPPGIGKTSAAYALANSYNWKVIELNASDSRTKNELFEKLRNHIRTGTLKNSKYNKLILIDEADGLYGSNGRLDNNAFMALKDIIKVSKNPIILTCNNSFPLPFELKEACIEYKLKRPSTRTILALLKNIVNEKEGLDVPEEQLEKCIVQGDIRSSIKRAQNYVETMVLPTRMDNMMAISKFQALDIIFSEDPKKAQSALIRSDMNPKEAIMWIEEKMVKQFSPLEMHLGYKMLEKADIALENAYKTGNYKAFWSIANRLLSVGIATSRLYPAPNHFIKNNSNFFNQKRNKSWQTRQTMKSLCEKLTRIYKGSGKEIQNDVFPILQHKVLEEENSHLIWKLTILCRLDENEVALLLDTNASDLRVKKLFDMKANVKKETKQIMETQKKSRPLTEFFQ